MRTSLDVHRGQAGRRGIRQEGGLETQVWQLLLTVAMWDYVLLDYLVFKEKLKCGPFLGGEIPLYIYSLDGSLPSGFFFLPVFNFP